MMAYILNVGQLTMNWTWADISDNEFSILSGTF